MRFTDPNLFVHVRYNPKKGRPGKSLRVFEVPEANTNKKITTLTSIKKLKGPENELLIFGDGSRIEGANYHKLFDFLKERNILVNCLGRILVTTVVRKDHHPPPQATEKDCLRVYDYFPWHEYGGPPNLKIDNSWVPLDLKQNKIDGHPDDEEKKLSDKLAKVIAENTKLQQKYDELVKKYKDDKKKEEEENPIPKAYQSYLPIDNLPFVPAGPTDSLNVGLNNYPRFSPPQIACKNYGIFFGIDPSIVNFQNEVAIDIYNRQGISVVAYGESYAKPFNGSTRLLFMRMDKLRRNDNTYFTRIVVDTPDFCTVDTSIWTRTDFRARTLESKPGSIWSA